MTVSPYQAMWLFALFDLPVDTPKNRKQYTRFRKVLLKDGFAMLQYSVYARFCGSEESAAAHRAVVRNQIPALGQVRLLTTTDHQFGKMEVYLGKSREAPEAPMLQLELF